MRSNSFYATFGRPQMNFACAPGELKRLQTSLTGHSDDIQMGPGYLQGIFK